MARDIETIKKYCKVSDIEESLLKSSSAPIVILSTHEGIDLKFISPDSDSIGFLLPYSPLHELIFDNELDVIIMTSGNKHGEPICISNNEAFSSLRKIVDAYLCHDREINLRNDDSLVVVQLGKEQVLRRARGYAPNSIYLKNKASKSILAMGAELKNTIALIFDDEAVITPHIGDLETIEANESFNHLSKSFSEFYKKDIQLVVRDLHPDMRSSRQALKIACEKNIQIVEVQHHHAHAVSCMAEHGLDEAIAVVFDGTGLGTDGNIWGSELLYVNRDKFERLGTFKEVRLPGGDVAVYNPVRQLVGRYIDAGICLDDKFCRLFEVLPEELNVWKAQCIKGINAPYTQAAGRLFDSISTLLGIVKGEITYEGQAAIKLETEALHYNCDNSQMSGLIRYNKYKKDDLLLIDWSETFRNFQPIRIMELYKSSAYLTLRNKYAYEFHKVLSSAVYDMINHAIFLKGDRPIVISGGVFMNKLLTKLVHKKLADEGLRIYINERVPTNDGGISFGQAVIASYKV